MKLATWMRGSRSASCCTMSCRTRSVAVAVKAAIGTSAKSRAQPMELAILGTEVVTPVRDAMSLIDDQRGNAVRGLQARQDFAFELGLQRPLGSDVQQLELAALEPRETPRHLRAFERRVDERRVDAVVLEQAHLVLHQRDQRRDHDAYAGAEQGGQLEAQRLAAAGRHDREHVAAARVCRARPPAARDGRNRNRNVA